MKNLREKLRLKFNDENVQIMLDNFDFNEFEIMEYRSAYEHGAKDLLDILIDELKEKRKQL